MRRRQRPQAGETVEVAAAIRQGGGEMDAAREGAGELGKAGGDGVDLVLGRHRHEDLAVAMRQHVVDGDRKSVVSGKGVSVRVDLGGRRISKQKKKKPNNYRPKRKI